MVMKIEETLEFEAGYTRYRFNVLSDPDGIRLWLTDWEHKIDGMKVKRWSHIGDNGTFTKRDDIFIPDEVVARAKEKIVRSIQLMEKG
ncbi:hypothetical protein [Marinobacter sp. P4B1]|uniref:hypothetical protein n=1 Tax=Marinobacter sp. P4B1 TaxID=1119533 RepID=UPI00071D094D|nr:hypothetical protein [Marinobacter sp. P4B1]KRW83670.1 hypothetical protein AQ621_16610 [Marinobacter sp. P4B1]